MQVHFDITKKKLEGTLINKWHDQSKKYYGVINEDGTFTLQQKVMFSIIVDSDRAVYLKGKLKENINGTVIDIVNIINV